jgi:hypothetical protein
MDIDHSAHKCGRSGDVGPVRERLARLSRLITVTGALLVLGVTAAACSGGSSPGVASAGGTATTAASNGRSSSEDPGTNGATSGGQTSGLTLAGGNATQALAFSQCMRAHGVADFPDPNAQGQTEISGGPNSDLSPNNPIFQKATNACQSKMPKPSPAQQAQALQSALKMSQCMRDHGITDFPDPQSGSGGRISISLHGSPGSDLNPNDPAFQRAQKVCMPNAPKLPTKQSGGSGPVSSTGGGT